MLNTRNGPVVALTAAVLLIVCAFCSKLQAQTMAPRVPKINLSMPVQHEPMPVESGELMRTRLADGRHIRIEYRRSSLEEPTRPDGGTGLVTLREDGTWESQEFKNSAGDVIGELEYGWDAEHTVASGWLNYKDGSKLVEYSTGAQGESIFDQYWPGNRLFLHQVIKQSGEFVQEFHDEGSPFWIRRGAPKLGVQFGATVVDWQESSDDNGQLRVRQEFVGDDYVETFFRDDRTTKYRRTFSRESYGSKALNLYWVDTFLTPMHIEEFAADGVTVVRKIDVSMEPHPTVKAETVEGSCTRVYMVRPNGEEFSSYITCPGKGGGGGFRAGATKPYFIELPLDGGKWRVLELDKSGLVISEQIRDANGVLSQAKRPAESILYIFEQDEVDVGLDLDRTPVNPDHWWRNAHWNQ
jgi:hypothetical protein